MISSHILSELSLLCTDYIFINHGKIMDTLTAEELNSECSEYYQIDTDNNELASAILTNECKINKMEVLDNGSIRIYEGLDDIRSISKKLYVGGVIPTTLARNEANLEDYYMKKVQAV
jgi:ABC-2 type transport system ATP-binding protein